MKNIIQFAKEECQNAVIFQNKDKVAFRWFRTWQSIELIDGEYRHRYFENNNENEPNDFFAAGYYYSTYNSESKTIANILMQKCFLNRLAIDEKWWKLLFEAGEKLWPFRDSVAQKYDHASRTPYPRR